MLPLNQQAIDALEDLLVLTGEGVVAFDDSGAVVFSSGVADRVLSIKYEGGKGKVLAEVRLVDGPALRSLADLTPDQLPGLLLVKSTPENVHLVRVAGLPAKRLFVLHEEDSEKGGEVERELLDVVAHDLRAGLLPAKTYAQMLTGAVFGPLTDKQIDVVKTIDFSLQKQVDRIADVLDMVKAEENRLELQLATASLADIVRQVATVVERDCKRKKVQFSLEVDPSAALVEADSARLLRILTNLLSRSLKQTPAEGAIGLDLRYLDDRRARIRLWDAGAGSSDRDLEILFKTCAQQARERAALNAPVNLELAAFHDILHAHQGVLRAHTEPGAGTTYLIYLPVQRRAGTGATPQSGQPAGLAAGLEPQELDRLQRLSRDRLSLTVVPDGKQAIFAVRARHYPLVFVSGGLTEYDAQRLIAAARVQRPEDRQAYCVVGAGVRATDGVYGWDSHQHDPDASLEQILREMLQRVGAG
ncbi:MAG TPA: ATP-binding protein [Planctomycetota bacterium]